MAGRDQEAARATHEERPLSSGPRRSAELRQLVAAKPEVRGDLPAIGETFIARAAKLRDGMPDGLKRVVVVPKLRDVVAQIGFTRLEPVAPDLLGRTERAVEAAHCPQAW